MPWPSSAPSSLLTLLSKKLISHAHTINGETQGRIVPENFRDLGADHEEATFDINDFLAILLAAWAAWPVGANNGNGKGEVVAVPGKDLIVHIIDLVPPGSNRSDVAKEILANQGHGR